MSSKPSLSRSKSVLVAAGGFLIACAIQAPVAFAQESDASTPAARVHIKPSGQITFEAGQERTAQDRAEAEALQRFAPSFAVETPRFRTPMGDEAYARAKAGADAEAASAPFAPKPFSPSPLAPPVLKGTNVAGATSTLAGGSRPPDSAGAVGLTQFAQTTNSHFDVYNKVGGSLALSETYAAFFGYSTEQIFDARIQYDSVWNRWVVVADAFPESTTVQYYMIAVSTTSDATGSYIIYRINATNNGIDGTGDFFDFPQLGLTQDGVILTANIFGSDNSYKGARLFQVSKAKIYNARGFSVPVFTAPESTLTPPVVIDDNNNAFLLAVPTGGTTITKYQLTYASNSYQAALTKAPITVASYSVPPSAPQTTSGACTATANLLDTSDSRMSQSSAQIGNSLFNVHTIKLGSTFAAPKFYEFDTSANTVIQQGFFFASSTSFDFNASLTANANKNVFVTWSTTKFTSTGSGQRTQQRFSGRQAADSLGVIGSGTALASSAASCYNPSSDNVERWGDYSQTTLDPTNATQAWVTNELTNSTTVWGTRIGQIGF